MPARCDVAMAESILGRAAGVLLHVTSLPSGRLDDDALRWIDFMADAGLGVWQVLPLVIPDGHGSPYQSRSAFAIDPAMLPEAAAPTGDSELQDFQSRNHDWLEDFALFEVLKERFGGQAWSAWPGEYRHRDPDALDGVLRRDARKIDAKRRQQCQLDRAWQRIRTHANDRGISLFGDIPIFVALDSAETWSHPGDFLLDNDGRPSHVAGVPPDYFSENGQRWGNPHYRWDRMAEDDFPWWLSRMTRQFELFDLVRIDHFRGLVAVWMIEATSETAIDGFWQETPGDALLERLQTHFAKLPIVAEDLGVITDEVRALKRKYGLPGMAVLQFAFDAFEDNPHKPKNIESDDIAYTGTHDNDTCVGWFNQLQDHEKDFVFQVLESEPREDIANLMIETALHSQACLAMAPLQDFLGLDGTARMNTPGVADGNWRWRFDWSMLGDEMIPRIREQLAQSGRLHGR